MMGRRVVTIERKPLKEESLPPTAATPAERLLMVWPLTIEAWALRGVDIAQSRFRDMLCMLNDEGVEYLVVGAHASIGRTDGEKDRTEVG